MVWWVISWFVAGFVVFLLMCADDMRGKPFNQCFTDQTLLLWGAVLTTLMGYISLVVYIVVTVAEKNLFSKFIYWLVNIGVKEEV